MVKKLSKGCQKAGKKLQKVVKNGQKVVKKVVKKFKIQQTVVGWGNSSCKAFGISFADRPKAIKRERSDAFLNAQG
jgi:hypothetical protein